MKPIFSLIAKDLSRDREGWCWLAVIRVTGELAMATDMPSTVSDEQIQEIFQFLATYGIHVAAAGNGGAGRPYANEPFIQWFPEHIVITQSGGLDV